MSTSTLQTDPFAALKQRQREMWVTFAPTAMHTTPTAAHLVEFSGVGAGHAVLDVGTGTGVVAITAARFGAQVSALDLTPELLEHARENAAIANVSVDWKEGDAESLPYPDASFDLVLSQFGHMFAPRPEVAISEMRRVLKPGGVLAFASWPPEHFVGRMFAFLARNSPPPPAGAAAPPHWGNPAIVAERLAAHFEAPFFARGTMRIPALSLAHFRSFMEKSVGPVQKLVEANANNPANLAAFRAEFDALAEPYFAGNQVHQDYLLTRSRAR